MIWCWALQASAVPSVIVAKPATEMEFADSRAAVVGEQRQACTHTAAYICFRSCPLRLGQLSLSVSMHA